ncbi:MAG: YcgL domain-containing protein [Halieaceae bacterium]|nr:YcgL domain-containing protein [Halieaceae bacterium]
MLCQVYRSPRKEQMYLYVSKADGLERVPEALLAQFGEPEPIMLLNLDGSRKLARADADEVVAQIDERGYYLQMPPSAEELRRGA